MALYSNKVSLATAYSILFTCLTVGIVEARSPQDAVAKAFEEAKGSRPELIQFLHAFPKGADLHNHLDGTVTNEDALKSAKEKGLNYDLFANAFTSSELGENVISIDAMLANAAHYRAFREAFSVRAWKQVSGSGRDQFFNVFGRIFTE